MLKKGSIGDGNHQLPTAGLVGIGGFSRRHLDIIMLLQQQGKLRCSAFVARRPESNPQGFAELQALGAQHYSSLEDMLSQDNVPDLVVVPTPLAEHRQMCIAAMERGCHVLLEKPPAVTVQDMQAMLAVQQRTGKLCQVNFQQTASLCMKESLCLTEHYIIHSHIC